MANVLTIARLVAHVAQERFHRGFQLGLIELQSRQHLRDVPAHLLLVHDRHLPQELPLERLQVLRALGRDLLDGVGRPHPDNRVVAEHALENSRK